jgi:hypothetical protein
MGMSAISKSQVYKLCQETDERVVSVAVVLAIGINADARREVLGMDVGLSEAETLRVGGAQLRVLGRIPAQAVPTRHDRCKARGLGCPRRPKGGRHQARVRGG